MRIVKNLFSFDYCDYLVNRIKKDIPQYQSDNTLTLDWTMWNIWQRRLNNGTINEEIKKSIEDNLKPHFNFEDYTILWLQMTQYHEGRCMVKHKDASNNETMILILSDGFIGGDTLVEDVKIDLNKGDGVFFSGYNRYHEVTKVIKGIRNALILWYKPKKNKLI